MYSLVEAETVKSLQLVSSIVFLHVQKQGLHAKVSHHGVLRNNKQRVSGKRKQQNMKRYIVMSLQSQTHWWISCPLRNEHPFARIKGTLPK